MSSRRQFLKIGTLGAASFAAPSAYSMRCVTMTYNTGNPLGSTDFRDFDDNVKSLDIRLTSRAVREAPDRLGVMRKTWHGIEQDFEDGQSERHQRFNAFIASSGYQFLGDYAAGIEITEYNHIVRDSDGEFWRLSGKVGLPYTTSGSGLPEKDAFVPIGDAALRQELADPDSGASMVARGVVAVASIVDLLELPRRAQREDLRYLVKGYHAGSSVGGGEFYWSPSDISSESSSDPSMSVYVAPDGGASGGFVRAHAAPFQADWLGSSSLAQLPPFVKGEVVLRDGAYTAPQSVTARTDIHFTTPRHATLNGLPVYRTAPRARVVPPADFPWRPPMIVTEHGGTFRGHVDLWSMEKASRAADSITYYLDPVKGSNGADSDGLTPSTAYRSFDHAFNQAVAAGTGNLVLKLASGHYHRRVGWAGKQFAGNLTVLCEPGTLITTAEMFSQLTWSNEGGGVWSTVRTVAQTRYGIFDKAVLDQYGKPSCYTPVESVDQVAPGTFYYDSATSTMYTRTADSRTPDEHVMVMVNEQNGLQVQGTVYVRGATFIGGDLGSFSTGQGANVVALFEDCDFSGSGGGDGLRALNTGLVIVKNCHGHNNFRDGFNYHTPNQSGSRALEVDCQAWSNGLNKLSTDPQNSNGTSAHESYTIVRVNTVAWDNYGPNIVDVGDVSAWCIGCRAADSAATHVDQRGDYTFTDNVSAWMDGCTGGFAGYQFRLTNNANVKVRGWSGGYNVTCSPHLRG